MNLELRLAELLCTRLCHDLTGPIGAVNNGAEFLSEKDFSLQDQAVDLIVNSAEQAVHRLMFYRNAYGRVNHAGEASLSETRVLIRDFIKGTRFELDWPDHYTDAMDVSTSRKMTRLILNMIIIVMGKLPRGGNLKFSISNQENGETAYILLGEGAQVRVQEDVIQALYRKISVADVTPKTVQPYFAMRLADDMSVKLSHTTSDTHFELKATHP